MEKLENLLRQKSTPNGQDAQAVQRRLFLRQLGLLSASTAAFMASCTREPLVDPKTNSGARVEATILPDGSIDLGSGDIGISNLAYTLDQLETAFYATAVAKATSASAYDRNVLAELHDHEVAHREFFKAFLGGLAIPMLDFDFSGIDFTNRNAVFDAAQQFENVGVAAFNGTGPLIQDVEVLKIAGKMVSVEARHATLARHMISPKKKFTLAHELINAQGLDWSLTPAEVLAKSQPYIKQKLSVANLPTY